MKKIVISFAVLLIMALSARPAAAWSASGRYGGHASGGGGVDAAPRVARRRLGQNSVELHQQQHLLLVGAGGVPRRSGGPVHELADPQRQHGLRVYQIDRGEHVPHARLSVERQHRECQRF